MHTVTDITTGRTFAAEHIVWTNGDSDGFTPLDTPMALETAERFAYPDAGLYNDRQPWAWDAQGCDETLGCFRPIKRAEARRLLGLDPHATSVSEEGCSRA